MDIPTRPMSPEDSLDSPFGGDRSDPSPDLIVWTR